jgi:hypothetical protein
MVSSISLYYCVHNFLTIADNFSFGTLLTLQQRLFNMAIYYEIIRAVFDEQHIKTLFLSNEILYIYSGRPFFLSVSLPHFPDTSN